MEIKTIKLHHQYPYLTTCEAIVLEVNPECGIVLDRTVAYAEMGGQLGDSGVLQLESEGKQVTIPFTDTQKGVGRALYLPDFPVIQVDTPVYHAVSPSDLAHFKVGQSVRVEIDVERRAMLTISHTGIHLVLMGLENLRPGYYKRIRGCGIKETMARLDFGTEEKFTPEDALRVQDYVNNLIAKNLPMDVYAHPDEPEAWYWELNGIVYPCGGTHLLRTGNIGQAIVKRQSLGRLVQRMGLTFTNHSLPFTHYHDTV